MIGQSRLWVTLLFIALAVPATALAQRGGRGGGGHGGGSRGAAPSMVPRGGGGGRPMSAPARAPSTGGMRPGIVPQARPQMNMARPPQSPMARPQMNAARPQMPQTRPQAPMASRPNPATQMRQNPAMRPQNPMATAPRPSPVVQSRPNTAMRTPNALNRPTNPQSPIASTIRSNPMDRPINRSPMASTVRPNTVNRINPQSPMTSALRPSPGTQSRLNATAPQPSIMGNRFNSPGTRPNLQSPGAAPFNSAMRPNAGVNTRPNSSTGIGNRVNTNSLAGQNPYLNQRLGSAGIGSRLNGNTLGQNSALNPQQLSNRFNPGTGFNRSGLGSGTANRTAFNDRPRAGLNNQPLTASAASIGNQSRIRGNVDVGPNILGNNQSAIGNRFNTNNFSNRSSTNSFRNQSITNNTFAPTNQNFSGGASAFANGNNGSLRNFGAFGRGGSGWGGNGGWGNGWGGNGGWANGGWGNSGWGNGGWGNGWGGYGRGWGGGYGYGGWGGGYPYLGNGWYNGSWGGGFWPGFGLGGLFGWLTGGLGGIAYNNPYCYPSTTVLAPVLDYSQPIVIPVPTTVQAPVDVPVEVPVPNDVPQQTTPPATNDATAPSAQPNTTANAVDAEKQEAAKKIFDDARSAFKNGDYAQAQDLDEQAIKKLPGDVTLHEFRALTLFAQKKYRDAAGTLYAVLAAGPGWNWDTLKGLYPDVDTYTAQLRALEQFQTNNPNSAEASFVLAYHYLTLDEKDAAIKQLEHVVEINPKDQLSAQMLKLLKQPQTQPQDRPKPQQ